MKKLLLSIGLCGISLTIFGIDDRGIQNVLDKKPADTAHIFYNDSQQDIDLKYGTAVDVTSTSKTLKPGEHVTISESEARSLPKIGISKPGMTTWWITLQPQARRGSAYFIQEKAFNGSGLEYKQVFWDKGNGKMIKAEHTTLQ